MFGFDIFVLFEKQRKDVKFRPNFDLIPLSNGGAGNFILFFYLLEFQNITEKLFGFRPFFGATLLHTYVLHRKQLTHQKGISSGAAAAAAEAEAAAATSSPLPGSTEFPQLFVELSKMVVLL